MSVGGVARGGLFLFVGSLIVAILGFVYWFLISILGGAEVVGIGSSAYSLSLLVSGIAVLGIPVGVQRFLGGSFGKRDIEDLNEYFWSSFVSTTILCVLSGAAVWIIAILNLSFMGFSTSMLLLTGLAAALSFYVVNIALFSSIVKTEYTAISLIISAIIRVCSGVFLVYLGFGWVGAVVGLIIENAGAVVLMSFFALKSLRRLGGVKARVSWKALKASLKAGSVNWLPAVIALLGQQLSFLSVFGIQGSLEAGSYYIAYSIFGIIYMIPGSFMSILFPILSGLNQGCGEVAWKVLKLCLALACPLTAFLMVYSVIPLSIMGQGYVGAAPTLSLLASSTIPLTFASTVYNLVYASGSYGKVLGIGLALNVPRIALYYLLVPVYGGFGAALAFLTGAILGLGVSIVVSMKVHFKVSSKKIIVSIVAPSGAALGCFLVGLNWLLGGAVILLTSVLFFGRSGLVERADLSEIAKAFASEKTIAKVSERLNRLLKIIYGE